MNGKNWKLAKHFSKYLMDKLVKSGVDLKFFSFQFKYLLFKKILITLSETKSFIAVDIFPESKYQYSTQMFLTMIPKLIVWH